MIKRVNIDKVPITGHKHNAMSEKKWENRTPNSFNVAGYDIKIKKQEKQT